jgi:hypothetical protein
MSEHDLEPFATATRELLESRLSAHDPTRDLADVVEQAHALAPDRVSRASVEDAGRRALSPPPAESELSPVESADLEVFEADARALLEAALSPRDLAAVVPPRPRMPRRRRRWTWAAAAAVLLVAGGAIAGIASLRQAPSEPAVQAEHVRAASPGPQSTEEHSATRGTTQAIAVDHVPAEAPETAAPSSAAEPAEETSPPPKPSVEPDPRALVDRLAELDALAQSQWKAGNPGAAEKTFKKIVKLGGRSQYAEQAYGELFALAHQLHAGEHQAKLWRAYLRRFPHGRYADTARAGLCRESEGKAKRQCWTRYLQKHPKGAARAEALRETAD